MNNTFVMPSFFTRETQKGRGYGNTSQEEAQNRIKVIIGYKQKS